MFRLLPGGPAVSKQQPFNLNFSLEKRTKLWWAAVVLVWPNKFSLQAVLFQWFPVNVFPRTPQDVTACLCFEILCWIYSCKSVKVFRHIHIGRGSPWPLDSIHRIEKGWHDETLKTKIKTLGQKPWPNAGRNKKNNQKEIWEPQCSFLFWALKINNSTDQTISNKPFHIFVSLPSGDSKQRQHLDHNFCSASTQLCLFFDQENFKKKRWAWSWS